MDDSTLAARRAQYLQDAKDLIDEHGWMVQGVFPTADTPTDEQYPFAYTVGLSGKGLPELIVFGLPPQIAKVILNDLARRQIEARGDHLRGYQVGDVIDDLAQGYSCVLIGAADTTRHLTMANAFFGVDGPVQALQLVFQDAAHRWPWHTDYQDGPFPILGLITDEMRNL